MHQRTIIWDWNGTLLDDVWLCVAVINQLLVERSLKPLTTERYRDIFGFPIREYYRLAGFDFGAESFEAIGMEFIERYNARIQECRLQPGALDLLQRVHHNRLPQIVISAREQKRLEIEIDLNGVRTLFDAIIGVDNHYGKGKLELTRRFMTSHALTPQQVLLIGDTCHDLEIGQTLGIPVILATFGHQSAARLGRTGAPLIGSLAELDNYLQ